MGSLKAGEKDREDGVQYTAVYMAYGGMDSGSGRDVKSARSDGGWFHMSTISSPKRDTYKSEIWTQ